MIAVLLPVTVILALTWMVSLASTRAAAATRHYLWLCAVLSSLAAPMARSYLPSFEIPMSPRVGALASQLVSAQPLASRDPASATPERATGVDVAARNLDRGSTVRIVWTVGTGVTGLWFLFAYVAMAVQRRRAGVAPEQMAATLEELKREQGVRQSIDVRIVRGGPFTAGVFRPFIALPAGASSWPRDTLRIVFLHELAHIRRRDCLTQVVSYVACCIYWFNPLIWIALAALGRERERACDDDVLRRGVTATSYARSLLELARDLPRARRLGVVLAMARPTDIECRLNAILRAERSRAGSRALRVVIAGAMAVAVILAASGRISAVAPESAHPIALSDTARPEDSERAVMRLALDSSSDVVPTLIDALQHRDAQVREKAALGLAWRNDARVLPALTRAVRDADSQVREKVAIALGSAGHPGARDGLLVLLNDPDDQVREKASAGLVLLGMMAPSEDDTRRIRDGLRTVVNGLLALANR